MAKADRAHEHFETLNSEWDDFAEANPNESIGEFDHDSGWYIWRLVKTIEPPVRFSALLGDFVHNLRCTLDHLVVALATAEGHPPSPEDRPAFPIVKGDPGDFAKSCAASLKGVHPDAVELIDSLQPYKRGDRAEDDLLYVLRSLDDTDKHRFIHTTAAWVVHGEGDPAGSAQVKLVRDVERVEDFQVYRRAAIREGEPVARARAFPNGPNPKVDMQVDVPVHIALDDGSLIRDLGADLGARTMQVLGLFEEFIKPPPD